MSVANAQAANQALNAQREAKREGQLQAVENLSTKEWLQQSLEDQAKPVPIMGREFYFTPIGNARVEEILELANSEAAQLDDSDVQSVEDVEEEHLDDMPRFVRAMRETLEENCMDDYMAEEGLKLLPLDVLQGVFEDVAMGGNSPEAT